MTLQNAISNFDGRNANANVNASSNRANQNTIILDYRTMKKDEMSVEAEKLHELIDMIKISNKLKNFQATEYCQTFHEI